MLSSARHALAEDSAASPRELQKLKVGILGATGTVGQRFIQLLHTHRSMAVHALGASARSAGKPYAAAANWKLPAPLPDAVKPLTVSECTPENFKDCDLVFSGLDSDVAGDIEFAFFKADIPVFSNAKNYRDHPEVPLVVPLVNPAHLDFIPHQRKLHGLQKGFLVTNSNCSTAGLAVVLHALTEAFGTLDKVIVNTLQAISGAGYPGVPSLDIIDNVVPYISGEEEKMESEPLKILGGLNKEKTAFAPLARETTRISATCNRVPVVDGHTECVSVSFKRTDERPNAPTPEEVADALRRFTPECVSLRVPSAPAEAIVVLDEPDRPQPRLDRHAGGGNSVSVGRIRPCNVLDVKLTLLVHNTILGAAGSGILNAELAAIRGYFRA